MATRPTITVGYKNPSSGSPSTITVPIQRVSWNVGRRNLTDNWTSSIATIFGRNPDTLFGAAGTGGPQINDVVRIAVSDGGSEFAYFYGSIQDVRILYGFSTNYDTWEITVQGRYGSTGRNDQSFTTTAGDSTSSLALAIRTAQTSSEVYVSSGWGSFTSAQTLTGQVTNTVNTLMATEQGAVREYGQLISGGPNFDAYMGLYGRNSTELYGLGSNVLSDTSATVMGVTPKKYDAIEFLSKAQNYGSKVVVQATGLADQSSGTGRFVQTIQTINNTTSQAADLAAYVKNQLDQSAKVPYTVRFKGSNNTAACVGLADQNQVKAAAVIVFRGVQHECVIEGLQFDATPEDWTCSWVLSGQDQNAYLRLNDPIFGTLDYNRLGF